MPENGKTAALNLESVFTQPERCLGPGVSFEGAHEGMMGIDPRRDCAPTARTGRGFFIGRLLAADADVGTGAWSGPQFPDRQGYVCAELRAHGSSKHRQNTPSLVEAHSVVFAVTHIFP